MHGHLPLCGFPIAASGLLLIYTPFLSLRGPAIGMKAPTFSTGLCQMSQTRFIKGNSAPARAM